MSFEFKFIRRNTWKPSLCVERRDCKKLNRKKSNKNGGLNKMREMEKPQSKSNYWEQLLEDIQINPHMIDTTINIIRHILQTGNSTIWIIADILSPRPETSNCRGPPTNPQHIKKSFWKHRFIYGRYIISECSVRWE